MDYVRLGTSGLKVSRICLGMMSYGDRSSRAWHLDEEAGEPIVRRAVKAGATFFDTADMYDGGLSEEITGRLLGRRFERRDDYVLATKVYYPMGTDHVDLYQVHRRDPQTLIEETMGALHDVVRAGKARYIGASAMFAWQLAWIRGSGSSRTARWRAACSPATASAAAPSGRCGRAAIRSSPPTTTTPTSTSSTPCGRWRPSASCRPRRSRWPGCSGDRR